MSAHTREALFSEISRLEERAFYSLNNSGDQQEFDAIIARTDELTKVAKERGWI